jgi:hypothetical protein
MANTSNWYVPGQPYNGQPGQATYGGGGNAGVVQYRSSLDARRSAAGQLPYAQYPDGYLGTLTQDRRQDRLLDAITEKLTERSYQRGVHKGEKIANSDYFWPPDANPMRRIRAEADYIRTRNTMDVQRYSPRGNPVERLAALGKNAGLSTPEQIGIYKRYGVSVAKNPVVIQNPDDKARLVKMLPNYARTM